MKTSNTHVIFKKGDRKNLKNWWPISPLNVNSLSPSLYILCVETLTCKIRNNPDIKGFLLPGTQGLCYKVSVYADDMTCIVKSYCSLQCFFNMINVYEGRSGARLNVAKTEAMWLGVWRSCGDQPLGLKWVMKMKILGVVFGHDTDADNWRPTLDLCVPKWVISKVNNLVWPFLWGSCIEMVSQMTCHQSLGKGGLGIFNFQTKSNSPKLASLVFNLNDRESKSFFLTKYFLGSRLSLIDVSWKIAHGVLYMAQHLMSFGMPVPLLCFCGAPVESLEHLFFSCPLAQSVLSWLQSLLFPFSPTCPCVLFFLVSTWMSCMLHLVSLCTFSICLSFSCGIPGMISGFMVSVLALWRSSCRLRCTQGSTSHYFSSALNPFAANATSMGNGELAVLLPLLSMAVCL